MSVFSRKLSKMLFFTITFTILALALLAQNAQAAVWTDRGTWNDQTEAAYKAWVNANWSKDFFLKPGPFQGLDVDCADAVYSMRFVYAAQAGLPFVIKDPTGRGVISNKISKFDSLPQAQRPRAFLAWLFDVVSTTSIPNDTYPVAVKRSAIGSGTVLLTDARSHHSWTIKFLSPKGIPYLLFSSRPAKTHLFERFEYPSFGFTFVDQLNPSRHAGFRNFRKPEHVLLNAWEVPGYSIEQYQLPKKGWSKAMQARLQTEHESAGDELARMVPQACNAARERIEFVNEALAALKKIGNRCMTAKEFDDYSTPSRDQRLKDQFVELGNAFQRAMKESIDPQLKAQASSIVNGEYGPEAYCQVKIGSGLVVGLGHIYKASISGRLSTNPQDSLKARWGLEKFPSGRASQCPVY